MNQVKILQSDTGPPGTLPRMHIKDGTYSIVSKVAYLIGVAVRIFENPHEPPELDVYLELERDKKARIIRNLCRLRTAIELNYKAINDKMLFEYKPIYTMSDIIPIECIDQLHAEGISIYRSNNTLNEIIIEINKVISNRINNCKEMFPIWINWSYIRELFIMPDGLSEQGITKAAAKYYKYKWMYPYQMYLNWSPSEEGNILYSDKKFVALLYQWHNDIFGDYSKISDASAKVKGTIYDFIQGSTKTVIVVDCENSDPYKLCSALRNLDQNILSKVSKIILYDDIHSSSAWKIFDRYVQIPVEHVVIERVKQNKSLVDIRLTGGACREFYQNHVDSFIVVSSDSDYWGLISSLPEARFLLMVEHGKCGPDIKTALKTSGIYFCYLDDFYSESAKELRTGALVREVNDYLSRSISLNIHAMMQEVYRATRVDMTEVEKQKFLQKYIKTMHLVMAESGNVRIEIN